jgi:precorrin-2 dehydrogenase/sirohydrochlorin ferrochelatase
MPHAYPMMLDVADRLVVIVGGGSVAARKAAGLIECGATRVRCVAPGFAAGLPDTVERVVGRYDASHLEGAGLVFAATDDSAVNAAVVRDARARGVLVNRADADDAERGDFVTPARLTESAVTVTVSAGSPALAALIRDGIREHWDDRWSEMADAMRVLRPLILRQTELPESRRREIFRDLATPDALDVLAFGGVDALRAWLAARHPELSTP